MDTTQPAAAPNATLFVQNNQIQLHANGGTYGLALLEDGSLIATPQTATPHFEQKLGTSSLSPNVIAALSAATGLSPQEITSWAASLPAGSTVKVTHHYDSPASKAASTLMKQTSPSVSTPKPQAALDHVLRQQRQQLTLEMASSACHDSLISACVGLPSYQESFAVDPNEILSKDRGANRLLQPTIQQPLPLSPQQVPVIKQEPPFMINTPPPPNITNEDDFNNNSNRIVDEGISPPMISDDFSNCGFSNPFDQTIRTPSVINMANSRLLNMENNGIKQEPGCSSNYNTNRLVQTTNHHQMPNLLNDLDLDEFPTNMIDDMDISGFNLNEQDFSSIKSIVEQTFKDGRDVLDFISAV